MTTSGKDIKFEILRQYWGYTSFYKLQEETIDSILADRDSVTMLPTGGGKSLCFQLPALIKNGTAVVISPLISLMKDQVDSLLNIGVKAACLNSSMSFADQQLGVEELRQGKLRLLYISPERLLEGSTLRLLKLIKLSFFVIDEAHCISHWGHDFRAAYRGLKIIKEEFSCIAVHAFTATATEAVQKDIVIQLNLKNADIHVGSVDRPNLTYRVFARNNLLKQIIEVLDKHLDEPGIIYCLRKKDVDNISEKLNALGYKTLPYHAGLTDKMRHDYQEAFLQEKVDIMVATIAFGMGIDRSNIRFVIHAAMPKSIEHYQQETGRAGRDGLSSFCYLFYGGYEFRVLSSFLSDSPNEKEMLCKLQKMYNFCAEPKCRHKVLVEYFGQKYEKELCDACDYCLEELELVENPLIVSQKILSCVFRVNRAGDFGFGAGHITDVLLGKTSDRVRNLHHDKLSTFALMKEESIAYVRYMIEQLLGQGFLVRDAEFGSVFITPKGNDVLRGNCVPVLVKPLLAKKKKEAAKKAVKKLAADWSNVDKELFELLRKKRMEIALEKNVPPYIIFGDKSLKDMASLKPINTTAFSDVFGVGSRKLHDYGDIFIGVIRSYLDKL